MKVLKFGGTSLKDAARFLAVAKIICGRNKEGIISKAVVLSAPATVTNRLLAAIKTAENTEDFQQEIAALKKFFDNLIDELMRLCLQEEALPEDAILASSLMEDVAGVFLQITQLLKGVSLLKQCPEDVYAQIISSGERLSILLMAAILTAKGYGVSQLDPLQILLAEGDPLEAVINLQKSKAAFQLKIEDHLIYLMPGFMAKNNKGKTVLLGRNGSDYSATALAVLLKAEQCEIWTDVDGIYNCDPNLVTDANLLHTLSYQEAMELSYFGAKVLHPKTITPILQYEIPCLIKNTNNPSGCGTLISQNSVIRQEKVKAISQLSDITMVNIAGSGLKGMVGMAGRIFSCLSRAGISIILITQSSSEYSISLSIHTKNQELAAETLQQEFHLELEKQLLQPLEFIDELTIVSLIGDGMHRAKGVSGKFLSALADASINIIAIAQGSSERSISVVVNAAKAEAAVTKCHEQFFNSMRYIDLFLLGCGGVGAELLRQIHQQQSVLEKNHIGIRVCGIANSKKLLSNGKGIDLSCWKNNLQKSEEKFTLAGITALVEDNQLINPLIVDCTSNEDIAGCYVDFLSAGFHVVAANKKANTKSFAYYQQMRVCALENRRKFLYDTNVGAGLPVIDNLKNLILAGDKLKKFNGILSGSLSYIFGELDEGKLFSEVTLNAKEKGFTEPDPRDDLSGMDVARKLLILAREAGLKLELEDIEIQSALPENFPIEGDINDFMQRLPEVDSHYKEKISVAAKTAKVLRYVGSIEGDKCKVSIKQIDESDPLYKVKDGENALAFYSRYYNPIPLVLRGYGAGAAVTAAGVYSDVMKILL